MAGKATRFIMRVEVDRLERWKITAREHDTSVASLLADRMDGSPTAALIDAERRLAKQAEEITSLTTQVGHYQRSSEEWERAARYPDSEEARSMLGTVVIHEKIDLTRHFVFEPPRQSPRVGTNPIAPADPTSEKAVAKVLPVAGVQFDRQPTWWEKKQQPAAKIKGKS